MKNVSNESLFVPVIAAISFFTLYPQHYTQAAVRYNTVMLPGDNAPGMAEGVSFGGAWEPVINDAGQVAFLAYLVVPGEPTMYPWSMWITESDTLKNIVVIGMPAAGTEEIFNNLTFLTNYNDNIFSPTLNNQGLVAFNAGVSGALLSDSGKWSGQPGDINLIARSGDPAPGFGGDIQIITYDSQPPSFNDNNQSVFYGGLYGTGIDNTNKRVIWYSSDGTLTSVARQGDPAPGTTQGVVYEYFTGPGLDPVSRFKLNNNGEVAFPAVLTGTAVDTTNNTGIWTTTGGQLNLAVRMGDDTPDTQTGVKFGALSDFTFNNAGQIAFTSKIAGPETDSTNDSALWLHHNGATTLLAREGDAITSLEPGVVLGDTFSNRVLLAGEERVALITKLAGAGVDNSNELAMMTFDREGAQKVIARTGDHAPGTAEGIVFSAMNSLVSNSNGQIAFKGTLAGPGITGENAQGIWATDTAGVLQLIAREGGPFDIDDDPLVEDFRTIKHLYLTYGSNGEDGRPTSLNNSGQITFELYFSGLSTGVFVAQINLDGDLNADGFVGIEDLNIVLGHWNQDVTPGSMLLGDLSGDGFVGIEDLNIVLGNWNAGALPPNEINAPIPEPATILLFLPLLLPARSHRRNKLGKYEANILFPTRHRLC